MLNNTQRQLLTAATEYLFEDIVSCTDKTLAGQALQALQDEESYQRHQQAFANLSILDSIDQLRQIYQHPHPQNRSTGSPYVGQEEGFAVWRDAHTHQICKEPLGLLSLTAQNDNTAEPVKKQDVIAHLDTLIDHYLVQVQEEKIKSLEAQLKAKEEEEKEEEEEEEEEAISEESIEESSSRKVSDFFALPEQALLTKAQAHLTQREHNEALIYLNQLVTIAPQNAQYRYLRGRSLAILGRREEALGDLNFAIRYAPTHAQAWIERGFTRENLEDIHGAIQDYTKGLVLNSQHHFALCQRGGLYMRTGQRTAGEQDFLASLAIKADDSNTYRNRGEQYLYAGRYPEAIADFDDALRLRPDWDPVKAMKEEAQLKLAHASTATTAGPRCLMG